MPIKLQFKFKNKMYFYHKKENLAVEMWISFKKTSSFVTDKEDQVKWSLGSAIPWRVRCVSPGAT